jgi:polysaccharide pyruvyl transferase WcaK-like protein
MLYMTKIASIIRQTLKRAYSLLTSSIGHLLLQSVLYQRRQLHQPTENLSDSAHKILVLPPTDPGSLGDEAMMIVLAEWLSNQGIKSISLLYYHNADSWQDFILKFPSLQFSLIRLPTSQSALARFWLDLPRHDGLRVIGADVMDGFYGEKQSYHRWRFIVSAAKLGIPVIVQGFSFNNQPKPSSIAAIRQLPDSARLLARDPKSLANLRRIEAKANIGAVADLAFLLSPDSDGDSARQFQEWHDEMLAANKDTVFLGLNPNFSLMPNNKQLTIAESAKLYTQTILEVMEAVKNIAIVLLPHDNRKQKEDTYSEFDFGNIITSLLTTENPNIRLFSLPEPTSAKEIKYIVGQLDFVCTGKMHLAIAALGAGTPVYCIKYQDKFEGLLSYFGLNPFSAYPEDVLIEKRFSQALLAALADRDNIKKQVANALPEVLALSQANFSSSPLQ